MSKTNSNTITEGRPKGVAVSAAEALELLQSAIWHCRQNGIEVKYVNKPGVLWLGVAGAELTVSDGAPAIRPIQTQTVSESDQLVASVAQPQI